MKQVILRIAVIMAVVMIQSCTSFLAQYGTVWNSNPGSANVDTKQSKDIMGGIKWDIKNDTLFIYGTGKMPDFSLNEPYAPWRSSDFSVVVIKEGVTSIGDYAFAGKRLKSIVIPNSMERISIAPFDDADYNCPIKFANCKTNLFIHPNRHCFFKRITPDDVSMFDNYNNDQSMPEIVNISDLSSWCSHDFLYDHFWGFIKNPIAHNAMLLLNGEKLGDHLVIPEGVTKIGDYAFCGCKDITSVKIPNSVTTIGNNAFSDCENITTIEMPNSVTTIGNEAFSGCENITTIEIPNSVTTIGINAFLGCKKLTSADIPDSVTNIGYGAFSYCESLTSISIGKSVTKIPKELFRGSCNITKVNINNLKAFCESDFGLWDSPLVGANLYVNDEEVTNIIIPEGVTKIGEGAFNRCANLVSVKFPNSLTSIGESAFYGCKNLSSITIPNPNTAIGDDAFDKCKKLEKVSFSGKLDDVYDSFYGTAFIKKQELDKTRRSLANNAEVKIDNSDEALFLYAQGTWTGKIGYYTITITFKANKTYTATVKYRKDYNTLAEWSGKINHHRKVATGSVSGKWDIRDFAITPLDPFKYSCNATYTIDGKRMNAGDILDDWLSVVDKYFSGYTHYNCEDGSHYKVGYDKTKKKQLLVFPYYNDLELQRVSSPYQKQGAVKKH